MKEKVANTTIEILGKFYPIRCPESELAALQKAASFLNEKMMEVQDSGKVINLERIAIISALNITYQFLRLEQHNQVLLQKINNKLSLLKDKLDVAINKSLQSEFEYASGE